MTTSNGRGRCRVCGETLIVKEITYYNGAQVSYFPHPRCEAKLEQQAAAE